MSWVWVVEYVRYNCVTEWLFENRKESTSLEKFCWSSGSHLSVALLAKPVSLETKKVWKDGWWSGESTLFLLLLCSLTDNFGGVQTEWVHGLTTLHLHLTFISLILKVFLIFSDSFYSFYVTQILMDHTNSSRVATDRCHVIQLKLELLLLENEKR